MKFDKILTSSFWAPMFNDHEIYNLSAYCRNRNTTITIDSNGGAFIYGERVVNTNYKRFFYPHQLYYSYKYKKLYHNIRRLENMSTEYFFDFGILKNMEVCFFIMGNKEIEKTFKFLM